jgi:PPK2 family polyphosphate:nucleotide phosphotransferase
VKLSRIDPDSTPGAKDKTAAQAEVERNRERLFDLQYRLYAENRRALLVVLQAMDTAGKDGLIRHVVAGLNPQGCRVTAFKAPSAEELDHDYLWRIWKEVPAKGDIGIFNRSHYEDVLVVRVRNLVPRAVWRRRYAQINDFEEHLTANGVAVVKFFLHISPEEQLERLKARLADPKKHWKFSPADVEERKRWSDYMRAYEDALERCSTGRAPWYVIPANRKWYRDLAVSHILIETLEEMNPRTPKPAFDPASIRLV